MSHLNIYINDQLMEKVKASAKMEKLSISKFICRRLSKSLDNSSQWPEGYFDLFGSLADSNLERPEQGSSDDDAMVEKISDRREKLAESRLWP